MKNYQEYSFSALSQIYICDSKLMKLSRKLIKNIETESFITVHRKFKLPFNFDSGGTKSI